MIKKINKFFLFSTLSVFVQSNFAYSQQVEENRDNTTSNVNNSENESLSDDEIVEKQKATFNPETNTDLETNSTPTTTHSNTAAQKKTTDDSYCAALNTKNQFSKKYVVELNGFGGSLTPNLTGNTWIAGARGLLHFNSMISVGAEYLYSTLYKDNYSIFGQVAKTNAQQIIDGQVGISFPNLFGAGDAQLQTTMFLSLGTGAININYGWQWVGLIGGGMKIYLKPEWIAIRIDVNTYLHNTPTIQGNKFGSDIAVLGGFAFFFPYKPAGTD